MKHFGLVVLVAISSGCSGCPGGSDISDSGIDAGDDGGGGPDGGSDGGTIVDVAFGIDTRPANADCVAKPRPPTGATLQARQVFGSLARFDKPILGLQAPGDGSQWFVIEQNGVVLAFDDVPGVSTTRTFIDIRARVDSGPNEAGLLGMAFHPDFATNGQVFLSYTANSGGLQSRISRFTSNDGGQTLDDTTEEILLRVDQPFGNHNGGNIVFGPDGYLYIGMGDGGSGGDPQGNGQNTETLLGAMLRIDVDSGTPYGIPSDNPFAAAGGNDREEIYAWGLRNPWRFSFDRATGDLWVADVGQNRLEEVDVLTRPGGNYGWNTMEGSDCYNTASCDEAGLELPITEYGRTLGASITGGHVYQGSVLSELVGVYLYADFVTGRIFGLFRDVVTGEPDPRVLVESGLSISSFAEGVDGELYVFGWSGGRMYHLDRVSNPTPDTFPKVLSATGCVDPADATRRATGIIPFDLNAPLWSDGASKSRWFALPDGETITIDADGDWTFPVGSVLIKEFRVEGRRIETRLFMRHQDGNWAGYSYEWNAAGTDADLLLAGKRVSLANQDWVFPSRSQCLHCHAPLVGGSIGPQSGQLNRPFVYSGGLRANQIATLNHIGVIDEPADPATLEALPTYDGTASAQDRARAYLHTNCSVCHQPGGDGRGNMDLRWTTADADLGVCNVPPTAGDLGLVSPSLVMPGLPARSVLSARMHATDVARMPPLATDLVDPVGTTIIDQWITELTICP